MIPMLVCVDNVGDRFRCKVPVDLEDLASDEDTASSINDHETVITLHQNRISQFKANSDPNTISYLKLTYFIHCIKPNSKEQERLLL